MEVIVQSFVLNRVTIFPFALINIFEIMRGGVDFEVTGRTDGKSGAIN